MRYPKAAARDVSLKKADKYLARIYEKKDRKSLYRRRNKRFVFGKSALFIKGNYNFFFFLLLSRPILFKNLLKIKSNKNSPSYKIKNTIIIFGGGGGNVPSKSLNSLKKILYLMQICYILMTHALL